MGAEKGFSAQQMRESAAERGFSAQRHRGFSAQRNKGFSAQRAARFGQAPGRALAWTGLCLCLVPGLTGCAGPRKYQPSIEPQTLDSTRFVHYLAALPAVTVDEAARAMILLIDGEETAGTTEERMAEVERRGWIRPVWGLEPDHTLDRATLGYLLFRACKLPDSANTMILGSWGAGDRRYAMRQAVAKGLMEYGPEYEPVTGGEFVAALTRADEYLHGGGEE